MGYLQCLVLFSLTTFEYGVMFAGFALVFLSVTRTYLISAAVQTIPVASGLRRIIGPRMIVLGVVVAAGLAALVFFGSEGASRWTQRVFESRTSSDEDYTWLTRVSEWEFMIDAWLASGRTFIAGNGLAAVTSWYDPTTHNFEKSDGFGHNLFISFLFVAGLAGGLPILILQFVLAAQAYRFLNGVVKTGLTGSPVLFLGAWGSTIVLGNFAANFLSSTLNNRGWALWYGIGTGLLLGARACFDPVNVKVLVNLDEPAKDAAPRAAAVNAGQALPPAVLRRRLALQQRGG